MIKEGDANLVDLLTKKIGKAQITIEELQKVYKEYGHDYNMDKAYSEEIEAQMALAYQAKFEERGAPRQQRTGRVDSSSNVEKETTSMKTGKLTI